MEVRVAKPLKDLPLHKPISDKHIYRMIDDLKISTEEEEIYQIVSEWSYVFNREIAGIISWSKKTNRIRDLYIIIGTYFFVEMPSPKDVGKKNCMYTTFHTHQDPQENIIMIDDHELKQIKENLDDDLYKKHVLLFDRDFIIQVSAIDKISSLINREI